MRSWARLWRLCPTRYACATEMLIGSILWSKLKRRGEAAFLVVKWGKTGLSVAQGEDFGFVGFQSEEKAPWIMGYIA